VSSKPSSPGCSRNTEISMRRSMHCINRLPPTYCGYSGWRSASCCCATVSSSSKTRSRRTSSP